MCLQPLPTTKLIYILFDISWHSYNVLIVGDCCGHRFLSKKQWGIGVFCSVWWKWSEIALFMTSQLPIYNIFLIPFLIFRGIIWLFWKRNEEFWVPCFFCIYENVIICYLLTLRFKVKYPRLNNTSTGNLQS